MANASLLLSQQSYSDCYLHYFTRLFLKGCPNQKPVMYRTTTVCMFLSVHQLCPNVRITCGSSTFSSSSHLGTQYPAPLHPPFLVPTPTLLLPLPYYLGGLLLLGGLGPLGSYINGMMIPIMLISTLLILHLHIVKF